MAEKPQMVMLTQEQVLERIHPSPDFKAIYANQTRIAPSFYDIRIFFGQTSITPKGEQTIEEQLCVILSPECAKEILEHLVRSLTTYEQLFGPIRKSPASAQKAEAQTPRHKKN